MKKIMYIFFSITIYFLWKNIREQKCKYKIYSTSSFLIQEKILKWNQDFLLFFPSKPTQTFCRRIERIKGIDYRQTYDGASRNNVGDRCCPVRSSVSDIAETSCSMTSDTSVCFSHGNGRKIIGSFRCFCHEFTFWRIWNDLRFKNLNSIDTNVVNEIVHLNQIIQNNIIKQI